MACLSISPLLYGFCFPFTRARHTFAEAWSFMITYLPSFGTLRICGGLWTFFDCHDDFCSNGDLWTEFADITSFSVKELPITSEPGSNSLLRLLSSPSTCFPGITGSHARLLDAYVSPTTPQYYELLSEIPVLGAAADGSTCWLAFIPTTHTTYHVRSIQLVGYRRLRRIAS